MAAFQRAAFLFVVLCWVAWAGVLLLGRRRSPPEVKRDPGWWKGMLVQYAACLVVWLVRRPASTPFDVPGPAMKVAVALLAAVLSASSVLLIRTARHALGKQWAYQARLVQGHRLVTDGPYAVVRHPIYGAFFLLVLATGLVNSKPLPLLAGIMLFAAGTAIRVQGEDRLLRAAFGPEFDAYARLVPALIPRLLR